IRKHIRNHLTGEDTVILVHVEPLNCTLDQERRASFSPSLVVSVVCRRSRRPDRIERPVSRAPNKRQLCRAICYHGPRSGHNLGDARFPEGPLMNGSRSPADVLEEIRRSPAQKVKVAITDIDGILRGKYVHKEKFLSAAESGFGFCNVVFGWD